MTLKNFKKSSSERLKESRRYISKYSVQNLVPKESTLGHESGFRGQINLYWKKRNAENLRYQNMLKEKNNG